MSELTTDQALGFIADGLCDCMGTLEERHTNGCPQDSKAKAWLAQVRREAKIEALREAAKDSQMGPVPYGWNASGIASWLLACAEQIEDVAGK